jgi:hypothetical protein
LPLRRRAPWVAVMLNSYAGLLAEYSWCRRSRRRVTHKRVVSGRILPRFIQGFSDAERAADAVQLDDIAPVCFDRGDGVGELWELFALGFVPGGWRVGVQGPVDVHTDPVPSRCDGNKRSYRREVPHGFAITDGRCTVEDDAPGKQGAIISEMRLVRDRMPSGANADSG